MMKSFQIDVFIDTNHNKLVGKETELTDLSVSIDVQLKIEITECKTTCIVED